MNKREKELRTQVNTLLEERRVDALEIADLNERVAILTKALKSKEEKVLVSPWPDIQINTTNYDPKVNTHIEGACAGCCTQECGGGCQGEEVPYDRTYEELMEEIKEDEDFLANLVCNTKAPEECESCQ